MGKLSDLFRRLRAWLDEWKVLFETVAATLLSVMAVAVSCQQSRMTDSQTQILELQTRLAEAQVLPQFVIHKTAEDESTIQGSSRGYTVENRGGLARGTRVWPWAIATAISSDQTRPRTATVALRDLLSVESTGSVDKFAIREEIDTQGWNEVATRFRELRPEGVDQGWLSLRLFVVVEFRDVLNRQYSRCFEVRDAVGGVETEEERCTWAVSKSFHGPSISVVGRQPPQVASEIAAEFRREFSTKR